MALTDLFVHDRAVPADLRSLTIVTLLGRHEDESTRQCISAPVHDSQQADLIRRGPDNAGPTLLPRDAIEASKEFSV